MGVYVRWKDIGVDWIGLAIWISWSFLTSGIWAFLYTLFFLVLFGPRYDRWITLLPSSLCLRGIWRYKRYMRGWGWRSFWATRDPITERLIRARPFTKACDIGLFNNWLPCVRARVHACVRVCYVFLFCVVGANVCTCARQWG